MKTDQSIFIHESSIIDTDVKIGNGTRIWHFCHVMSNVQIGKECILGHNVFIGPDVKIGNIVKIQNNVSIYSGVIIEDRVFIGPSVTFTNVINPRSFINRKNDFRTTLIKVGATLGANSTILCGVVIGMFALIGAGSVVTHDVPSYALVYGNPARLHGWICECGHKLQFSGKEEIENCLCQNCQKNYIKQELCVSLVNNR